ncbi:MAG: hypothetical protein U0793_09250 [Gemmataceae bacterium]
MIQTAMRLVVTLLLPLWLCTAGAGDDTKPKRGKPDLESVRAAFAKKPCKALTIIEPVEVKQVLYWKDGGSLGLELKDAKGTVHRFALDGREKGGPRNLFLGVTYPGGKEGKRVEIWAVEEQELYAVLLRWVKRHPQRDAFLDNSKKLDESKESLWEFAAFFARMDDRFRQMNDLPPRSR